MILIAALTIAVMCTTLRRALFDDLQSHILDAVKVAALQVDGDAHLQLTKEEDMQSEGYARLSQGLRRMRDATQTIKQVYTMRLNPEGQIVFGVDAAEEDPAILNEVFEGPEKLAKNFSGYKEAVVEDALYSDRWGTWLSAYAPFFRSDGTPEGWMGMDIDASLVIANQNEALYLSLGLFVLAVAVSLALGALIGRSLAQPILVITQIANLLAEGEQPGDFLSQERQRIRRRRDEIGQINAAFDRVDQYFAEIGEIAGRLSDDDFSTQVTPRSNRDILGSSFVQIITAMRSMIDKVADSAEKLDQAAKLLSTTARQANSATDQIAKTMQQAAESTSHQASSVSRTASSIEEMTRAIERVAHGAQEQSLSMGKATDVTTEINNAIQQVSGSAQAVTRDSARAAEAARSGAHTVDQTVEGMQMIKSKVDLSVQKVQEMGQRSDQIGAIVDTIEEIASQTNLLALNASIEAARAGEHGKSFAVVADEVRKLAERASTATKEIGGLIRGIQKTVDEAVTAMEDGSKEVESGVTKANEAGRALSDIIKATEAVYQQANQVTLATERMGAASNQLVDVVNAVSAVVEENNTATGQMTARSSDVTRSIENIASASEENSAAI